MAIKFSWTVEEVKGGTRFFLSGFITEQSDFSPIVTRAKGWVVLDLAGIDRINSGGVGAWLSFINGFSAPPREVILDRCSVPMVHQFSMLSNISGRARVRSVLLPYLCRSCGAEQQLVLDLGAVKTDYKIAEAIECPNCKGQMEFDDLPDSYLSCFGA